MKSPFKYGKVVTGKHFINRKEDIKRIQNNISAGINTMKTHHIVYMGVASI